MSRILARIALGVSVTALAGISPAAAQTLFPPAPKLAEFGRYTTPQQCLAAASRAAVAGRWGTRSDTVPLDPDEPLPPAGVEAARDCGGRFSSASVESRDLGPYFQLALAMGDDAEAARVLQRRLSEVPEGNTAGRAAVLLHAVLTSLGAQPSRREAAIRLAAELDALGPAALVPRLTAHWTLADHARLVADTTLLRRSGTAWVELAALLPAAERFGGNAALPLFVALNELAFLDIAREASADRWIERARAAIDGEFGPGAADEFRIGHPAPPLEGNHWFGTRDPAAPRPTPGRWSLLVWVDQDCGAGCYPRYAMLRRLHQRFGADLDITLIGRTRGYFRLRPPPSPAEEVELMREHFLETFDLPGALTISETQFLRRPDPDRRVSRRPTANEVNYGRLPNSDAPNMPEVLQAMLVDPRGRRLGAPLIDLSPQRERLVSWMLEVLLRSDGSRS